MGILIIISLKWIFHVNFPKRWYNNSAHLSTKEIRVICGHPPFDSEFYMNFICRENNQSQQTLVSGHTTCLKNKNHEMEAHPGWSFFNNFPISNFQLLKISYGALYLVETKSKRSSYISTEWELWRRNLFHLAHLKCVNQTLWIQQISLK